MRNYQVRNDLCGIFPGDVIMKVEGLENVIDDLSEVLEEAGIEGPVCLLDSASETIEIYKESGLDKIRSLMSSEFPDFKEVDLGLQDPVVWETYYTLDAIDGEIQIWFSDIPGHVNDNWFVESRCVKQFEAVFTDIFGLDMIAENVGYITGAEDMTTDEVEALITSKLPGWKKGGWA